MGHMPLLDVGCVKMMGCLLVFPSEKKTRFAQGMCNLWVVINNFRGAQAGGCV